MSLNSNVLLVGGATSERPRSSCGGPPGEPGAHDGLERTLMFHRSLVPFLSLVAATAAAAIGIAVTPASAAGTDTLFTEPDAGFSAVYSLISGATTSIDMTMYELADTTAEQDLAAAASRGVRVRVILY